MMTIIMCGSYKKIFRNVQPTAHLMCRSLSFGLIIWFDSVGGVLLFPFCLLYFPLGSFHICLSGIFVKRAPSLFHHSHSHIENIYKFLFCLFYPTRFPDSSSLCLLLLLPHSIEKLSSFVVASGQLSAK